MAIRFADGVGYYDSTSLQAGKRYTVAGLPTVLNTGGPFGDYYIHCGHGSINWTKSIAGTSNALVVACRYRASLYSGGRIIVARILDGSTTQISLEDDNGTLKVYNGHGTLIATASAPILPDTWQEIEMKFLIAESTSGQVTVRVDTVAVITDLACHTQFSANDYANAIRFGGSTDTGVYIDADWTHIIVMDTTGSYCNDFLGNRRVQVFMPTSDGNYKEFACSTGSDHFELVNEIPPNETDYNESDAAGERDTFGTGSVSNANASIDAVVITAYCKTDDGGAASIKALVRSAGDDGEGTEVSVPSAYGFIDSFVYVDPDTTNPFTVTAVNAAEKGYKRQT